MPDKVVSRENLKAFREKIDDKYVIEGEYSPSTSVGLSDEAENLTPYGPNSGASDQSAFRFQTTGGSSDVGALAYQKKLLGNTVAFNQLIQIPTTTSETVNGLTITNNNDGSITISGTANADTTISVGGIRLTQNHKFLLKGCPVGGSSYSYYFIDANYPNTRDTGNGVIYTYGYSWTTGTQIKVLNGTNMGTGKVFRPQIFDLTLLGKEYKSVVDFNRDYPLPYYSFNAGQLFSCKTNKVRNVGHNAYDNNNPSNYIKVVARQKYTLEGSGSVLLYDGSKNALSDTFVSGDNLPNNCQYVVISGGNSTTCFYLTWDGSRTGFEPYQVHEYAMPNIELKGGYDSNGNHWGDELLPDGTLKIGAGVVDLGSLEWTQSSNGYFAAVINDMKLGAINSTLNHARCSKYIVYSNLNRGDYTDKGINYGYEGGGVSIRAKDTSISTDNATTFKNGLSGVYLCYELATPTTEQNDAYKYQEVQQVDDFGTQEALSSITESASTPIVPQGFDFFYPVDYKAFIDSVGGREDIEYAADQIVSQTQLANYLKTLSGYDSSKTQTLKNVNGVFTWVDDE